MPPLYSITTHHAPRTRDHCYSAANGRTEVVELLLTRGVNPDTKDDMEMTAADHATETNHPTVARTLKEWFRP